MKNKNIDEDLKEVAKEFGVFLKQKRKEKGFTLVELARKAALSHSYLSQLENGKRNLPPMATQIKIARALGVSIMEFPTTEEQYYSFEDLEHYDKEVDYQEVAENIKILSKDADNFRDEVIEDPVFRRAIQNYLDEAGYPEKKITPSGLLADLEELDVDTWKYLNVVRDEIADLAERFSKYNQYVTVETGEILEFMNRPSIKYNGRLLTSEEKERIISMLELMFPSNQK
ncbi:helix-turn-helix domain-containing protein [Paenibacillus apiarius]|uniref:Helix-turn-helix domain-containing protein n=1 Tax=Paenibacillus apiarius TaxID=46240 RepID=A0ABT4DVK6_9BACL|nr:helix-turn-helix transcriptional regulator [Paenibacillus apiarius]MCY9513262.1 helix-turn-helix domain-containing protein [Paenibacillus apiarius]MCY9521379.1 helix-turn-helix domain-containing protein [Paenibacillus apiarius]MCY9554475.1 helix-turn-helix domain-containing protein [Paenibacillus apiarius]MCY9560678.1 helix-turn-helix domain-containing protein [Paenibacillus apiarius]MCY9685071.1 helix-turn-helix domain-containing protein [Paenibacillus apiarius]